MAEPARQLRATEPEPLVWAISLPDEAATRTFGRFIGEELRPVGRQYLRAVARDDPATFLATHPELVHK